MELTHDGTIATEWEVMKTEKGDIVERAETYGLWTIPSITMDVTEQTAQEADKGHVVVGARLVNHLSNRIVDVMFPHDKPFFTIATKPEAQRALEKEAGEESAAKLSEAIRSSTVAIELAAMRGMNMTAYRPMAVLAVKHMIISGNAMIKRMKSGVRVVYGVRDFSVRRSLEGKMTEAILRDAKKFGNLPEEVKTELRASKSDGYDDTTDVMLYSHYKFDGTRWKFTQAADNIMLGVNALYTELDFPLLDLTWSLARGENYGRGLVEDNAVGFHNLDVLTEAAIDLMSAMADLKFLVATGSTLDVEVLNKSPRGSYHHGNEGDITVPEIGKRAELQIMMEAIAKWERDLSQAFLLNSASTRDAERVTAEEIRLNARELESAYGGLYSRLALLWQQHEGEYAVSQVNFEQEVGKLVTLFEVVVTTGLESLSREGQLDNLRLALADMQMLDTVPDELRATMNPLLFASFVFTNRGVKLKDFLYTQAEMEANQKAAQEQQQAALDAEAQAKVGQAAGEAAIAEDQQ